MGVLPPKVLLQDLLKKGRPCLAWELSPPPSLRLLDEGMVLVCYLPAPLLNRLQLLSPL